MNRIDRLSAILIQLQTKKIIKANEIAERFEISLRTVYRDMKALSEAGVPIGAEAGIGYYLVEGYHLPPVMFTPEEAGALLIAEKLVENFSDESIRKKFLNASDKIKSVLSDSDKDFIGTIDDSIQILYPPHSKTDEFNNNHILAIQKALANRKCLSIKYLSAYKQEKSLRTIEPVSLCFYGFNWHLIAFCRLRDGYRDFRLDRVELCTVVDEQLSEKAMITLEDYINKYQRQQDFIEVVVRFSMKARQVVSQSKYYFGFYSEEEKHNQIEMHFAITEYSNIAFWLLSLGEMVLSVEPQELRDYIIEATQKIARQYLPKYSGEIN